MDAKLVVVGGKANKAEVKLKLPTVVGRGRDADLTVAHGTVSRHHCMIYEVDGALVVRDNGSLNGTLIGGERIKEALLRPGDTLTVGPLTFRADYEHSGAFPSLGDQPTIPNFQDTVGDEGASAGPAVAAEPSAAAGQFDFLAGASATAPTVEEEEGPGIPNFEQPAAEEDVDDAPAATAGEQTVDFLAGGSDVAPVSDEDAPGFDFLNQAAAPEAVEQAPAVDSLSESEPSSEIAMPEAAFSAVDASADTAEAPEPEAVADDEDSEGPAAQASSGSFDFLNAAAQEDIEDAPTIEQAGQSPAAEEPVTTAEVEDETVSEVSSFDFLNSSQAAAEAAPPELDEEAAAETTEPENELAHADAEPAAMEETPEETPVEESAGGFDFLNVAADDVADEPAAALDEPVAAIDEGLDEEVPHAEPTAESSAVEEPELTADVEDETVSEVSGFDFLNQSQPAAEEAPPEMNFQAAPADTVDADDEMDGAGAEPAVMEQAPEETPVESSAGGFDFLNAAADDAEDESAAALDEPAAALDDEEVPHVEPTAESSAMEEPELTADVEEESASEVSGFDFLNPPQPAAEDAPSEINLESAAVEAADAEAESAAREPAAEHAPAQTPVEESEGGFDFLSGEEEVSDTASVEKDESGLPQFDIAAETPAMADSEAPEESAADDDSSSFGFLGSLASDTESESEDAGVSSPELTLHDPEESDDELAEFGESSELADGPSLRFDDEETPVAESDDDSGEFALPLEEPAGEEGEVGTFNFLNETPAEELPEAAEAAAVDEGEGYALSVEPVARAPEQSFTVSEDADASEDEELAEEEATAEEQATAPVEESAADSQPQGAKAKKKGWWPFGKSKEAAPADTKSKSASKPVARPVSAPDAANPEPFNPAPAADADEAALGFLSDDASASSDDPPGLPKSSNGNGKQAAGDSAKGFQIQTDEGGKRPPSGGDDELNNFFESIGLD